MSLSTPKIQFLLDENVRIELFKFLRSHGFDVKLVAKSSSDLQVASISLKEKRVLVTNDQDFTEYSTSKVYAVIWLRIPQSNSELLLSSFTKLIDEIDNPAGKLILLEPNKCHEISLGEEITYS